VLIPLPVGAIRPGSAPTRCCQRCDDAARCESRSVGGWPRSARGPHRAERANARSRAPCLALEPVRGRAWPASRDSCAWIVPGAGVRAWQEPPSTGIRARHESACWGPAQSPTPPTRVTPGRATRSRRWRRARSACPKPARGESCLAQFPPVAGGGGGGGGGGARPRARPPPSHCPPGAGCCGPPTTPRARTSGGNLTLRR
jgi:hypothetical protein